MGYEADLGQHYKVIHNKLFPSKPKTLRPPEIKAVEPPADVTDREPEPLVFSEKSIIGAMPPPTIRVERPTIRQIIDWVCIVEKMDSKELTTPGLRQRRVSHIRFLVCHLARKYSLASYTQIAYQLGGMDHTSVIYGIKRIAKLRKASVVWEDYTKVYEKLLEKNFGDNGGKLRLCPSCPFKV